MVFFGVAAAGVDATEGFRFSVVFSVAGYTVGKSALIGPAGVKK